MPLHFFPQADKFDTLRWGYKLKEAKKDPYRFQRFVYETRIYHSGFSKRNLKRYVDNKIKMLDPDNVKQVSDVAILMFNLLMPLSHSPPQVVTG